DESPEPAGPLDEVGDLRRHNEELATKLKYLQAEFENYRKRVERDAETVVRFAHEALFARLLPVLDELDAAAAGIDGNAGDGVRMVRDNFVKALREAGLGEVPAEGLPFDPYIMDCIQQVADDASKDGVVKEVVRKGYRYRDRIVRPAQVIVVNNRGETNG
ncbi:MAG TPA: nucleotide exchange factor GrpE, partial [Thermoplasmata archaeon]|nr:nucleotide exchange factor GrpE [Thermoplasmata archaeon]